MAAPLSIKEERLEDVLLSVFGLTFKPYGY